MTGTKAITARELLVRLKARYKLPEWAIFEEVALPTGSRRADGLAVNLWPSRGLPVVGFEIKLNRRDWLKELGDPGKAEPWIRHCTQWFVVAASADIVRDGELPESWGLIVPRGKQLKTVKEAPKLEPVEMAHGLMAVLIRHGFEARPARVEIQAASSTSYDEGLAMGKRSGARADEATQRLREKVRIFEAASGVSVEHGWDLPAVGAAVRMMVSGGASVKALEKRLGFFATGLEEIAATTREAAAELIARLEADAKKD